MITETEDIAQAIDAAALMWPDVKKNRAELLRRLIAEAHTSIDARVNDRVAARRKAILEGAGKLSGVWPANWREELRDDWPE
jgi:hypothetical protein